MDQIDLPDDARDPKTGLRRLAPEIEATRDRIVDHFQDKPFSELKAFVQELLEIEEDETKRLGALAARVYMLRQRIIDFEESVELVPPGEIDTDLDMMDDANGANRKWARVRVLETCQVNGMRLPEGIIVDVAAEDAERLIESGHAELDRAADPDIEEEDEEFEEKDIGIDEEEEPDIGDNEGEEEATIEDDDEAETAFTTDTSDHDADTDIADTDIAETDTEAPEDGDHALAAAIAETAEAFSEIDVALAADPTEATDIDLDIDADAPSDLDIDDVEGNDQDEGEDNTDELADLPDENP
ncbi:MAG: hypothetical protein ISQ27_06775 [PS1 clade bacterium]|nr:hypothetical protein [PS1 clade bacterium]